MMVFPFKSLGILVLFATSCSTSDIQSIGTRWVLSFTHDHVSASIAEHHGGCIGVKKLFDQGTTGCIESANSKGDITSLYLKDFEDENGKIPPRFVDINSDMAQLFIENLFFLKEKDYNKAKQYVANPEAYDFKKILNWN